MVDKQLPGLYAPDGAKYAVPTDGDGNLVTLSVSSTMNTKQLSGSVAPDGSIYFCITDGNGTLQ